MFCIKAIVRPRHLLSVIDVTLLYVPRSPHVIYINSVAQLSGAELALLRTLPPLLKHVKATVILAEDGPLAPKLREIGATVIILAMDESVRAAKRAEVRLGSLSVRTAWMLIVYVIRLRRLILELDADLVHTNNLKSALYGGVAARLARKPVVWHVRDRISIDYLPRSAVWSVRLMSKFVPSAVIANSNTTLATLPRLGRTLVLSSLVVPDNVANMDVPRKRKGDPVVFGLVGRISPWKGQDLFLRAFAIGLARTSAKARLIGAAMFGETDFENSLHSLVDELGIAGQVEFRGFREDVWSEFGEIDVAVHASTIPEPFGQVIIEAMAAGVPVIAAAEGGPREIITDGVNGLLVPARNLGALADALERLAQDADLRASLAVAGKRTAGDYTPERTADGVLEAYRALLGHAFAL